MGRLFDAEFAQEYNKICGTILQCERKRRRISRRDLSLGLLSHTAMGDIEEGRTGWSKMTGDTLMSRMGVSTEYFEVVTSAGELDRWRLRENICLLALENPARAAEEVQNYRNKYKKRENVEEQFLQKVEVLLLLLDGAKTKKEGEWILKKAEQAVACTVPGAWKKDMDNLWLAPVELEAILLVAASLAACGEIEGAWDLQQSVWNYPKGRQWKERVAVLILPQAALLGMELALRVKNDSMAFDMGKEALELLRRCTSHCYALPLLKGLCRLSGQDEGGRLSMEDIKYLERAKAFRDTFRQVYEQFNYPEHRLWQGISVDNTRDAGTVLKMLRKFHGKIYEDAIYEGKEQIITKRQLQKIEKGVHKPSYENYQRLAGKYGKYGGWKTAMLETDSVEALELRQRIATLIGLNEWLEAELEADRLRKMVNAAYPRAQQELLFLDALFLWERDNAMEESLAVSLKALYCTVPDMEGKDAKYWVFQREEIIIASHIASLYRRMGQLDKSKSWFEKIMFSLERQSARTGIPHNGYGVLVESYDNLLGDTKCFDMAVQMNQEAIQNYLKWTGILCVPRMFYRLAWNSFEASARETQKTGLCSPKWRKAFLISESLAEFTYDIRLKEFLDKRREKFLC